MPRVSSSSAVAGTSSSDLTPDDAIIGGDPRAGAEVGRDVRRRREAAVHAAEAACPHEADADRCSDRQRAADGRRAERPLNGARSEIARAELARLGCEALELDGGEPDDDAPVEDADRRGRGAGRAHRCLARETHLDSRRRGKPVRDEGRLERDDGALLLEGDGNLVGDADQALHQRGTLRVSAWARAA